MPVPQMVLGAGMLKMERMVAQGRASRERIEHIFHFSPEELEMEAGDIVIRQMREYLARCICASKTD